MSAGTHNRAWGRALVQTLRNAGTGCFFLSPGARSSALVAALAELPADEVVVHYDERGAAFAALGWAKAQGRPAAVITTSGSAVVNLHPALIEASYGEVPLVFLAADRPPELHGIGANQTIHQEDLFVGSVRETLLLPCPDDLENWASTLLTVHEAAAASLQLPRGPVFINAPFREPLLPDGDTARNSDFEKSEAVADKTHAWKIPSAFFEKRGAIIIGGLSAAEQSHLGAIRDMGHRLGWPVMPDALSGGKGLAGTISHADLLLLHEHAPRPECILHIGGSIVSKRLAHWQSQCRGADYVQVRESPRTLDPWSQSPTHLQVPLQEFLLDVQVHNQTPVYAWDAADSAIDALLDVELTSLSEPAIARVISAQPHDLFLGNSMPVRDFDAYATSLGHDATRQVFGNRGASGIDGNVATMAGIARATRRPLIGLIGDLALLHDLNSLALLRDLPVTLVVVNNDGGGIFQFLPLHIPPDKREQFWETPHGMQFHAAADQFNLSYQLIESLNALSNALLVPANRGKVLECRTDRESNFQLHRSLATKIKKLPLSWNT